MFFLWVGQRCQLSRGRAARAAETAALQQSCATIPAVATMIARNCGTRLLGGGASSCAAWRGPQLRPLHGRSSEAFVFLWLGGPTLRPWQSCTALAKSLGPRPLLCAGHAVGHMPRPPGPAHSHTRAPRLRRPWRTPQTRSREVEPSVRGGHVPRVRPQLRLQPGDVSTPKPTA